MSMLKGKLKYAGLLLLTGLLTLSLLNANLKVYAASAYSPKVLIISNNDTYNSSSVAGGTSAAQMQTTLQAAGYSVTIWDEVAQGAPTLSNTNASTYDVVIFTQGVGYRSTNNSKEGLNAANISFLRAYENDKGHLLIEGEDVFYDMGLTGTSTDQKEILKLNTSSSRSDRGKIAVLKVTDPAHPVNQGLAPSVTTSYQTSWQDSLVADTGAEVIMNGTFGSTDYGVINTWDDGSSKRLVFMPFAWYVNASNGITDATWRNTLLLNAVKWLGEKRLTVTGTNLVAGTTPPNTTGVLMEKYTFNAVNGPVYLNGLTVEENGTATANLHVPNVKLYDDSNNNGLVDAGEPLLGSGTFGAGLETTTVSFASPVTVNPGMPKNLLVVYDIGAAPNDITVGASLTSVSSVQLNPDDLLSVVKGNLPVASNLTRIYSAGTAEIDSPLNNDLVGGNVVIQGTASTGYTLKYGPGTSPSSWTTIVSSGAGVTNGVLANWDTTLKDGSLNPITPDGWYTLQLTVTTGAQMAIYVNLDNTSPTIDQGPSASNITNRQATITWVTGEPATSKVEYKKSVDSTYTTVNNAALVTNHSTQLTGLVGGTSYDVRVTSVDAVGNSATSSVISFAALQDGAVADISVPAQAGTVGGVFDIQGTAMTNNPTPGASVQWSLDYGQGSDPGAVTSWTPLTSSASAVSNGSLYTWNTVSLSGNYTLRLVVTDPTLSGSTATATKYVSFTIDNTNPVISNIQVNNITNIAATVTWATDKPTTGQVSYRINGGSYGTPVADSSGNKQVFLAGLQANTLYYYQITVTDNYGHTVASPEQSFTTTNVVDTTPPGPPVWIAATGRTDTTVDLSWKAGTDNTGIAGYKLYRSTDGTSYVYITTISGTQLTYTDPGLNAGTAYYYKLTSVDLAGNESPLSASMPIAVPTVGAARINPHGAYPKLTDMCGKCHVTHRGLKSNLFKDTQEQKVCFTCHNGTGSQYNVQQEYDPSHVSRHPLPMAHTGKECASCHNPHLTASDTPRLLAPQKLDGTTVSSGPEVCLVCHGTEVISKVANDIGGSHQGFLNSIHNTSTKLPNPPSGTRIKCANCHNNHSSAYIRLTKAKEEQNCYQCHSDRQGAPPNMVNIESLFTLTSHHKVSDTDQADGSKVECVNCHNPHYVTAANKLSDPTNTNTTWTGNTSTFCLKCHNTGPWPTAMVSSTNVVPYTVNFPSVNFSNSDGWNKTGFLTSGHYTNGLNLQCTQCHDPHGSNNPSLTKAAGSANCTYCHDGSVTGAANITGLLGKPYNHPVADPAGIAAHSDTENYAGILTRHAQCTDCHNPHEANGSTPAVRNGADQGPLKGVSGVGVNWANVSAGAEPAAGDFIIKPGADLAAEVCLKCHSNYAYGASPPSGQTNQAKEFNPANSSVHPVFGSGNNHYTTPTVTNGNKVTMEAPFNQTANEHTPLKCTDCHGVDTTATTYSADTNVKGPHGSSNKYMLKKDPNSDAFCLMCHKAGVYVSGALLGSRYSLHHFHNGYGTTCRTCHGGNTVTYPNRKGFIHGTNAQYQDIVSGSQTPTTRITHFLSGDAFTGWATGTCYTTKHGGKSY